MGDASNLCGGAILSIGSIGGSNSKVRKCEVTLEFLCDRLCSGSPSSLDIELTR